MIDQKNRTPEQRGTPPPIASGRMAGDRPAPFIHSIYRSAITSGALTDFQLRLFMLLCIYAGRDGICNPSTVTLARELKRSRSGVIAAITSIQAAGFICKIGGNVGAGRGNTNQYRIVLEASGDATAIPENVHPGRHEQNIEKKQRTERTEKTDIMLAYAMGNSPVCAREPGTAQEQKQQQAILSFDFPVWEDDDHNRHHRYAADRIYFQAQRIGYTMTVQEVYRFLERMMEGKTPSGRRITNLAGLMRTWKANQMPETREQAQEEARLLKAGTPVRFELKQWPYWERLRPFSDIGKDDDPFPNDPGDCKEASEPVEAAPDPIDAEWEQMKAASAEKRRELQGTPESEEERRKMLNSLRQTIDAMGHAEAIQATPALTSDAALAIWYKNGGSVDADIRPILEAVERIAPKHPRLTEPPQTKRGILLAILRKCKSGLGVSDAIAEVERATEQYAAATAQWPESEHRFIVSSRRWFENSGYDEPPKSWERNDEPRRYVPRH